MARKRINVFNLSFLDIMSCGFGAVILFYMIISAQVAKRSDVVNAELLAESHMLEEEVLDGRKNLVRLTNTEEALRTDKVVAEGEARRLQSQIEELLLELAEYDDTSLAKEDSVEQLKADIKRLEEAKKRLAAEAASDDEKGQNLRSYTGQGNRQYLTGMKMGGRRILILVDGSSSMLGQTYVNIIRYRNMADEMKIRAPKWRRAVRAVDWITTQLPANAQFQMMVFNETTQSLFAGSNGKWLPVGDGSKVSEGVELLKSHVPGKGTSLYRAFDAVGAMDPPPDNIYLLTDGLPTQGKSPPATSRMVQPETRIKYFIEAIKRLPRKVPVNVLLYPMDGDPDAAGYFWQLVLETQGSFMTPSVDWP
jgi:hypothetical protein